MSSFTTALAISSGSSNKWLEVYTSVAGTEANHWEIGYSSVALSNSTVLTGTGSSVWSASTINFFFRFSGTNIRRKWHIFEMDRAHYAVDERADVKKPQLYINGDRCIASSNGSSAASGANSTAQLVDPTKSWETSRFSDSSGYCIIVRGTGAGQIAKITANTSDALATTWAVAPTSNSEYIIVGTDVWTKISSAIFSSCTTSPVKDVVVGGSVAYFAMGPTTQIGKFEWASSLHIAKRDASTNVADVLDFFHDPIDGPQLWRGVSSVGALSRASVQTSG